MAEQGPQAQMFQHLTPLQPQHKLNNRPNNNSKIILPHPHTPQLHQQPWQQIVHLNWSHFKPEFSGKPDEDAEAHLLCMNDWMTAHHSVEGVKVQRFCFNTVRRSNIMVSFIRTNEHRLARVTKFIRQQYSKIGNTREQLFHAWKSFSFDENTETIDAYVIHIRQVAALLGYGEPQILEVFKNTLPTKLYWILFPIVTLSKQ